MIQTVLNLGLIQGFIIASIIIIITKWGFIEFYETYKPDFLPTNLCLFCVGFWLSVLIISFYQIIETNLFYFISCFISASLSRFLIVNLKD